MGDTVAGSVAHCILMSGRRMWYFTRACAHTNARATHHVHLYQLADTEDQFADVLDRPRHENEWFARMFVDNAHAVFLGQVDDLGGVVAVAVLPAHNEHGLQVCLQWVGGAGSGIAYTHARVHPHTHTPTHTHTHTHTRTHTHTHARTHDTH